MRGPDKLLEPERVGVEIIKRGRLIHTAAACLVLLVLAYWSESVAQQKKRDAQPPAPPALVTGELAAQLEAVITTDLGVIRFEFCFDKAPKHV
ncbi:MAG TPA: hypothetical protein VLU47_13450, partial [Blastocatellia bacterium]|nr:hypothetical protein [Blastocatellia bacterium]